MSLIDKLTVSSIVLDELLTEYRALLPEYEVDRLLSAQDALHGLKAAEGEPPWEEGHLKLS